MWEPVEAAAGDDKPALRKFKIVAYTGSPMNIGWGDPVVVDLRGLAVPKSVPLLLQHDVARRIGHTADATNDKQTLRMTGVVSGVGPDAAAVVAEAENGFPWQASVGADPRKVAHVAAGNTFKANGREYEGPAYWVQKASLRELSMVVLGGDEDTSARLAANAAAIERAVLDFEKWVKARGFDPEGLTDEQRESLTALYSADVKAAAGDDAAPDVGANPPTVDTSTAVDAAIKATRDENARAAKIRNVCAGFPDIEAKAVAEGWTADQAELAVLRAKRPNVRPGAPVAPATPEILTAAVCMAERLPNVEKHFKVETLEAADKRYRNIRLGELLLAAAVQNGYAGRAVLTPGTIRPILQAAFSSADIDGILSTTANKFLLESYNAVESDWRLISAIRAVNDFKTHTSYRLTGTGYAKVAPSGEIQHGTLNEDSFTNKADTYGELLAITRQDIINDDLGALTRLSSRLGHDGAVKFNEVFWAAFMNNSAFFTAGRGNYDEDTETALSPSAMALAYTLFLNQTDADGKPLGIEPKTLLVPNALWATAVGLRDSEKVLDTTASTKFADANVWRGRFQVARSSYLANSSYTGYSTTAWYLIADPRQLAVIESCFLNGNETPIVESTDADFNVLGIQVRAYHDFGVTLQDYRAGVMMAGTNV